MERKLLGEQKDSDEVVKCQILEKLYLAEIFFLMDFFKENSGFEF